MSCTQRVCRRTARKKIAAGLTTLLILIGFCSCDQGMELLNTSENSPNQVRVDTAICLPMQRVRTWNPLLSADEDVYYIEKLIYEGLFRLDSGLLAEPVLADSYLFDSSGTEVTIYLKTGVFFHDGIELTADDVKFSIEAFQSASTSLYAEAVKKIRSVQVRDAHSLTLTFFSASDSSLEGLVFPILPQHQYASVSAALKQSDGFQPVGTGRYQVEQIDSGKEIRLVANPLYYGDTKAANTLTFKVISETANAVNLFSISDLNLMFSRDIDRETLHGNKAVDTLNFPSNEAELLGFNTQSPLLSQKEMRQAIAWAVDVTELLDYVYYNSGVLSDSLYYPGYLKTENLGDPYECDPERARTLLREMGYSDENGGYFRDSEGTLLTVTLMVNEGSALRREAASLIQSQLAEAGIDCQLQFLEWGAYQAALNHRNFQMFLGGYRFHEAYDLRFLLYSSYANPAGYANGTADQLLSEMESGSMAAGKQAAYLQLKEILKEELPYYCMFYKTYGRVAAWQLQGSQAPLFCDLYRGAEEWRLLQPVEETEQE